MVIANGDRMHCLEQCVRVKIKVQGVPIEANFYLLNLGGYKVVLGAQWLQSLERIAWDFSNLTVEFIVNNRSYML